MREDILASKRVHIMMDVISREGFDFSVIELHTLGEYSKQLASHIYELRSMLSREGRESHGYGLLFWGCSSDCGTGTSMGAWMFADRVQRYYEHIGDMEYYRGLIDA